MTSKKHLENKFIIPTEENLMRLYYELSQIGAPCLGRRINWRLSFESKEELLGVAFEWLRYDPRLLSILILYLKEHYKNLNPYLLRLVLKNNKTPQTIGVVSEFLKKTHLDLELKFFLEYLTQGLGPRNNELFFFGLHSVGGEKEKETALKSLKEYSKWGFLGVEKPIVDLTTKETKGSYEPSYRKKILIQLLKREKKVTLSSYLGVLHNTISRQQALYDLKHFLKLKLVGKGRGSYWVFH